MLGILLVGDQNILHILCFWVVDAELVMNKFQQIIFRFYLSFKIIVDKTSNIFFSMSVKVNLSSLLHVLFPN